MKDRRVVHQGVGELAAERPIGAHDGLLYRSSADYVDGIMGFLHPGLAAGDPIFIAVPAANGALLRPRLPATANVSFADMTQVGRNPARIIPAIKAFVDAHPRRRVRFVGEPIWPGRSSAEICEATRHEAMLNTVFSDQKVDILCPYDVGRLDPPTVADAWRTHPTVVDAGERHTSDRYAIPASMYDGADPLLPVAPESAVPVPIRPGELPWLRNVVRSFAADAGLTREHVRELVLAVNEVATNTLMHTPGPGSLRMWCADHQVICEVRDSGHLTDFLAGRHRPDEGASRGRGLWMANHLCDLVQIRSSEVGTTVRLHMDLPGT